MFISGHASVETIHTQVDDRVISKRAAASYLLIGFLAQLKTPQIFSFFS